MIQGEPYPYLGRGGSGFVVVGGELYPRVVAGGVSTPAIEQEGFAFGDDDGSESAHTLDTQDTNITEDNGTKTLRTLIDATGDLASIAYKLKYQKNGSGGYEDVPVGSANEVYVSTSSNVSSGGEATTARLTAPSGKTTGDFTTGRRWDDENGDDNIDIAEDEYTELEWILTIAGADTDDYFEFRVYNGDSVLDTYTLTPKWTIGSGGVSGTNLQINIGDDFKEVSAVYINIGDAWKEVTGISLNVGDTWKDVM